MNKIKETLSILIEANIIPRDGNFDVDEHMLFSYIKIYSSFGRGNSLFDYEYARKLAALNLLNLKRDRDIQYPLIKEGFVYLITNPAWKDHVKIGMTIDLNTRLSVYQTSSPFRDYSISNYEFVLDRKKSEKEVLKKYKLGLTETGEWIKHNDCEDIIRYIRAEHTVQNYKERFLGHVAQ